MTAFEIAGDPKTRVALILGCLITFTALMLLFIAGRIYTRLVVKGRWGLDDWLTIAACGFALLETTLGIADTRFGAGYHTEYLRPEWEVPYAKIGFVSGMIFSICISLPKLSLCVTYLRIFPSKLNRIFCQSTIIYIICFIISTTLVQLFACRPIAASWNPTTPDHKCISLRIYFLASGILNSVSDFIVFLFPAKMLWNLQIPTKQKVGVIAVFSSGSIVCVAGIIRLWFIQIVFTSDNYAYDGAIVWATTCIEVNVGIICGCLHAVKPLFSSWFPRVFGSSSGSNAGTYASKHRSRIADRVFPFQNLNSEGKAEFVSQSGSTQKPLADKNDITPQVKAWVVGGTDKDADVPAHGIAYSQHVTVDSTAKSRISSTSLKGEARSEQSVGASIVLASRNREQDADSSSQEWIMTA